MKQEAPSGIIGPSPKEIQEVNQLKPGAKPEKPGVWNKVARGAAAVLGLGTVAAGASEIACGPRAGVVEPTTPPAEVQKTPTSVEKRYEALLPVVPKSPGTPTSNATEASTAPTSTPIPTREAPVSSPTAKPKSESTPTLVPPSPTSGPTAEKTSVPPTATASSAEDPQPSPTGTGAHETTPKLSNDQIIDQIQSLQTSIYTLPKINPRQTDLNNEENKVTMDTLFLNPAIEASKNNDLDTAHNKLLGAKNKIIVFGDILKSVSVPKDIKEQHDPKGKYIKNDRVDPRILDPYLALVKLLVGTDKEY